MKIFYFFKSTIHILIQPIYSEDVVIQFYIIILRFRRMTKSNNRTEDSLYLYRD